MSNLFTVNALGKPCPQPVIEARNALKRHDELEVLVDNTISAENLKQMSAYMDCSCTIIKEKEDLYRVIIIKEQATESEQPVVEPVVCKSVAYTVVINSPVMGVGDEILGRNLMKTFIYTLTEQDVLPQQIIFYNGGVPLITEDSESMEDLKKLAAAGVKIYGCGACLDYYNLTDKVAVGEITNMFRIVEMMRQADRIVRP